MGISQQEALDLFRSDDLVGIGMAANQLRKKKNDPRVATYQIDRNINYTNFCTEYCSFCAFYRPMGSKDGYVLSLEDHPAENRRDHGARRHRHSDAGRPESRSALDYYENLLRSHQAELSRSMHLHCFSAPEILCIAEVSGLSVRDTIARLRDAGPAIRFPAAAPKFWTTKSARASRA